MLGALNYLNLHNICHRDIKLENIMLMNDADLSNLRLIDFGLSRNVEKTSNMKSLCSGTPFYIAPEVLNRHVTVASDIWSLGVVMYVCLCGKLPFSGHNTDEIFKSILWKEINIFKDPRLKHISEESKDLLNHLL